MEDKKKLVQENVKSLIHQLVYIITFCLLYIKLIAVCSPIKLDIGVEDEREKESVSAEVKKDAFLSSRLRIKLDLIGAAV